MPKKPKTKKLTQNDLRKMMNDMKSKRTTVGTEKRTLAANSGAYHKAVEDQRRIEELKKANISPRTVSNNQKSSNTQDGNDKSSTKRPLTATSDSTDGGFKEPFAKVAKVEVQKKTGGLPLGDYSSSSDEEEPVKEKNEVIDEGKDTNDQKPEEETSASLPEGFFDDPEVDAKIRGVETPSSAMDREWEDFQREIQKETGQSEQIIDEEEETGKVDRELEEINEQILHFSRLERLNVTQEKIKEKRKPHAQAKSRTSDDEKMEYESDEDIDEDLLDWREKDSEF